MAAVKGPLAGILLLTIAVLVVELGLTGGRFTYPAFDRPIDYKDVKDTDPVQAKGGWPRVNDRLRFVYTLMGIGLSLFTFVGGVIKVPAPLRFLTSVAFFGVSVLALAALAIDGQRVRETREHLCPVPSGVSYKCSTHYFVTVVVFDGIACILLFVSTVLLCIAGDKSRRTAIVTESSNIPTNNNDEVEGIAPPKTDDKKGKGKADKGKDPLAEAEAGTASGSGAAPSKAAAADAAKSAAQARLEGMASDTGLKVGPTPSEDGVEVLEVRKSSAGDGAGVKKGDVITTAAGFPLRSPADFDTIVTHTAPGTPIDLEYTRGKSRKSAVLRPTGADGVTASEVTRTRAAAGSAYTSDLEARRLIARNQAMASRASSGSSSAAAPAPVTSPAAAPSSPKAESSSSTPSKPSKDDDDARKAAREKKMKEIDEKAAKEVSREVAETEAARRELLSIKPSLAIVVVDDPDFSTGVLVSKVKEGPCLAAGVMNGDHIMKVGDIETNSFDDFRIVISAAFPGEKAIFTILRGETTITLPVTFGGKLNNVDKTAEEIKRLRALAGEAWCSAKDRESVDKGASGLQAR